MRVAQTPHTAACAASQWSWFTSLR